MPAKVHRVNSTHNWPRILFSAAIILFATLLAYHPALKAGFVWDDDDLVFANPLVTDAGGFRDIWLSTKFYDYFPLTLSSFWIEWRLWGNNATGYHVTNVLLHAFAAILFWRSLKYLKIPCAWIIALLFAVHPVNVESVAWIAERKNTLSLFFYALSLLFYLRSQEPESRIQNTKGGVRLSTFDLRLYWLSLAAFLLALLSKTSVVMLPVVLLGCAWWKYEKIRREDWLRAIPFFALSLVLSAVTIWFQYNRAIATDIVQENSFLTRLAGAGWAVWFYLGKIIWPFKLSFVYPRWQIDSHSLVSFLPTIAVIACFALFWFYRKSWGRPFLFAFGYFVVTLFPVLGFFNIYFQKYSFVADHWQYQSIIGPLALLVGGIVWISKKFAAKGTANSGFQPQVAFAGFVTAVGLSVLTFHQTKIYANAETLWNDTVQKNPSAWIAHNLLGAELAQRGELDRAMEHYSTAIRLNPNHAEAHNNLGTAFAMRGNLADATKHFRLACELNPKLLTAANSLAWILATHPNAKFRDGAEAVRLAELAAELSEQKDVGVLETLAAAYAEAGEFTSALKTAQNAIAIAKETEDASLTGRLAFQIGRYKANQPFRDSSLAEK
jgi:protein O-mannosyl-transferase